MKENILFGVITIVLLIIGIFYTVNFYKNCDGQVARGMFGLICIK